jgi:hypothetical protein
MIVALLSLSASSGGCTADDGAEIFSVVTDGQRLYESRNLSEGSRIRVTIAAPFGVLAMASHRHFVARIRIDSEAGGPERWLEVRESEPGFVNFGPNNATVEIVATGRATVAYGVHFLGRNCATLDAASSSLHAVRGLRNPSGRACFAVTDDGVEVSLRGSLGNGEIAVFGSESAEIFNCEMPIPDNGATIQDFYAVELFNNGTTASSLNLTFRGGQIQYNYDQITHESPIGVIGRGAFLAFEELHLTPQAESQRELTDAMVWVLCVTGLLVMPFSIGAIITRVFAQRAKSDSAQRSTEDLFDSQAGTVLPEACEAPKTPQPDELPPPKIVAESPYDREAAYL